MPDTPAWVRDAVFYQVFPDRFASSERVSKPGPLEGWDSPPTNHGFKGGDLLGIVEHLDHIAAVGANALYLNPIFQSASNHRYHTYDYLAVDPLLGGNAALRELLDQAHARGIRVVLDGVLNHTGRGFWPFHHVLETGSGSPYRSWFHFDGEGLAAGRPVNAYPAGRLRSGLATDGAGMGAADPDVEAGSALSRLGYEAWWGIPALPKLNVSEPAVREYLWGVAEHWLRFGIDGWRLDVPAEINDPPFWNEFRRRCRAVNPEAYLVGEIWHIAPEWVAGDRFDALMNYPLAKAILGFVGGHTLDAGLLQTHNEYRQVTHLDGPGFASLLSSILAAYARETTAVQLNLLGSHDTPRVLSVLGEDREALELAVLLQATLPGAPCIYYGDEVGMLGGIDPDSRRAFPWDTARWDGELLGSVQAMLALRHAEPALRADAVSVTDASGGALAFARAMGATEAAGAGGRLGVALNAGDGPATLRLGEGGSASTLLAVARARTIAPLVQVVEGHVVIELPPRSGAVVRLG